MADGEVKIPQEQIDALFAAIDRMQRLRNIMLLGYLLAIVVLIGGQIAAFIIVARNKGTFMGWVYLVPFALVGALLWGFGRLVRRPGKNPTKDRSAEPPRS